jgi:ferric-dicitrate binding protein FerR (iron transport regulator)
MMGEHGNAHITPAEWAARWLNELPSANQDDRAAFVCWIRQTPEHIGALLLQKMLKWELRGLDPQHRIDVETLIEKARRGIPT